MREHASTARRMIVGGAVLLGVALAGIAAAAAVLVDRVREGDRAEAESKLRDHVDAWLREIQDQESEWTTGYTVGADGRLEGREPEAFDPLPEPGDPDARFLVEQMSRAPADRIRRAAREAALTSE